jgi:hypothetical protein
MSRALMAEFDNRRAGLVTAALMAVCLVCNGHNAGATPFIVNGDFTADNWPAGTAVPASPTNLSSLTGWTLASGAKIVGLGAGFGGIPTASVDLSGWDDNAPGLGISQTLGTLAGQQYQIAFTLYDFAPELSKVNFRLNGTLLGSSLGGGGGGPASGLLHSYQFTAVGSDVVNFSFAGPANSTAVAILAGVTVTGVPEPSTYAMALAGLGFASSSMWLRRKRA